MAIAVKAAADVAAKWSSVTPGRSSYYEANTKNAGTTWLANTAAAGKSYQAAVQAGNIGNLFTGGVKKAGADKFNRKVTDVGVSRFGPGVTAAASDYQSGVTPMLDTIAALTLPARQPRGSDANIARVSAVATALNKKRLSLRAAGA